jgi:hypothetical protein
VSFDAPVVLFIFNRPEMTRRVFAAIREAKPSKLLVVSEGPRDRPGEAALCAETRAVFDAVDWECELHTNFADANMGLPRRFASAFDWIFDRVDEAIILEDDCLPHPTFFPYCTEMLERYRDNPRVMWICGTNPLPETFGDASYFFTRTNWVWGWATWKRAWQHFDLGIRGYPEFRRSRRIAQISRYRPLQRGFMAIFDRAYAGEWINWDAQATFTVWNNDGLCVTPNGNLVTNIGFGEMAENTTNANDPLANLPFRPLEGLRHPTEISVAEDYDTKVYDAHLAWMNDYAGRSVYRRLPLFRAAKRSYQVIAAMAALMVSRLGVSLPAPGWIGTGRAARGLRRLGINS